ncbi:MAG: hypothetical protein ACEPOW_13850 [Bacteroidales bacterium]
MNVSFRLTQNSKKATRTVSFVDYTYEGSERIDLDKLSNSITNTVFRKLDKQVNTGVNFGIKVSQSFNLVVIADNVKVLDLNEVFMNVTDGGKLKVNMKKYKEDRSAAKEMFNVAIYAILEEHNDSKLDFANCFETEEEES